MSIDLKSGLGGVATPRLLRAAAGPLLILREHRRDGGAAAGHGTAGPDGARRDATRTGLPGPSKA